MNKQEIIKQLIKDEYEQAIKREGYDYAKGYIEAMVDYSTVSNAEELKNEAIGFAKWIAQKGYETHKDKGKRFWGRFNEEKDYTASELYTIYLNKDV